MNSLNAQLQNVDVMDAELDAEYFEYSKAANPISAGLISRIPYQNFPASLYDSGPSRVVPLDLSEALNCEGPATGPGYWPVLFVLMRVTA